MLARSFVLPTFIIVAVAAASSAALAQTTTVFFTPAHPTAADFITARVTYQGLACSFEPTTTVTGDTVRMEVAIFGCVVGPPSFIQTEYAPFGPLPAGVYTYQLYFQYDRDPPMLQVQQPLVVAAAAPPSVPAINGAGLVVLTLTLVGVALLTLRRW